MEIPQESYPPDLAILRGYIPLLTVSVPNSQFLYHSIVYSRYVQVQVRYEQHTSRKCFQQKLVNQDEQR